MDLFNIPGFPSTKETDKKILNKTEKKTAKVTGKVGKNIGEQIALIKQNVENNLGEYRDKYQCIRYDVDLQDFIDKCIEVGWVAIDTETMGLNPMLDDIVGFSLFTPGFKAVYIPINHIDYMTNQKLNNQISKEVCKEQLQRLVDANVKFILFNNLK